MSNYSVFDFIFYQHQPQPLALACLKAQNRGLAYGDGFFETIRYQKGTFADLDLHYCRIQNACRVLKLDLSPFWDQILKDLDQASMFYSNSEPILLRLQIFRAGAGLYLPLENGVDWLISGRPAAANPTDAGIIGQMQLAQTIHTQYARFSGFKSASGSIVYVLAALERQQRALDALLLTDQNGQLSEACGGNIFWLDEKERLCTPSLSTGCINGIRRQAIIALAHKSGIDCIEVHAQIDELQAAKAIFVTNVNMIRPVAKMADWVYNPQFCKDLIVKLAGV